MWSQCDWSNHLCWYQKFSLVFSHTSPLMQEVMPLICHLYRSEWNDSFVWRIFVVVKPEENIRPNMFVLWHNSFPFDTNNPIGYVVACSLECLLLWCSMHFTLAMISFAFGSFLSALTMIKDIKRSLHSINKRAKSKQCDQLKVTKELADTMDLWSKTKQLSE